MSQATLKKPLQRISTPVGEGFHLSIGEISGSMADLGVMLPLVLALISLNGVDATSTFVGIGLAYILTGLVYRLPIPIQPLKSVSALALAMGLAPVVIVSGAIWNTIAFLTMGLAGLDHWVQKAFPRPVVRGIQLGLGYMLIKSAWKLIYTPDPSWVGGFTLSGWVINWSVLLVGGAALCLFWFLAFQRDWAAIGVIAFGIGVSWFHIGLPPLSLHLVLPKPFALIPDWGQMGQGFILLALPQIPLSLGNSIYATAETARQYFGEKAEHVTERRLMLTMGFSDLMAAVLGGVPVCHGSGGLTAHHRLGARTGSAPVIIGLIFLGLGLVGSQASMQIFRLIPFPVLSVLLIYVGCQHAMLARDLQGARDIISASLVPVLTILTGNLGVGFICGAIFFHLWPRVLRLGLRSLNHG